MSKVGDFIRNNQSGVLSAGTGILGSLFSIGARKKAFKRSKQLMDKQFKMDREMFDYQNAYNTPVQQMQRLKDAGLNPALMYGQGTTGNANNMVQSKFTELSPFTSSQDIAQSTAAGVQLAMANSQKKLLDNQGDLAAANTSKALEDAGLSKISAVYKAKQVEQANQEIANMIENRILIKAKQKTEQQAMLNEKAKAEINRIDANWLKRNGSSSFEMNAYRAARNIFNNDIPKAMKWIEDNISLVNPVIPGVNRNKKIKG